MYKNSLIKKTLMSRLVQLTLLLLFAFSVIMIYQNVQKPGITKAPKASCKGMESASFVEFPPQELATKSPAIVLASVENQSTSFKVLENLKGNYFIKGEVIEVCSPAMPPKGWSYSPAILFLLGKNEKNKWALTQGYVGIFPSQKTDKNTFQIRGGEIWTLDKVRNLAR